MGKEYASSAPAAPSSFTLWNNVAIPLGVGIAYSPAYAWARTAQIRLQQVPAGQPSPGLMAFLNRPQGWSQTAGQLATRTLARTFLAPVAKDWAPKDQTSQSLATFGALTFGDFLALGLEVAAMRRASAKIHGVPYHGFLETWENTSFIEAVGSYYTKDTTASGMLRTIPLLATVSFSKPYIITWVQGDKPILDRNDKLKVAGATAVISTFVNWSLTPLSIIQTYCTDAKKPLPFIAAVKKVATEPHRYKGASGRVGVTFFGVMTTVTTLLFQEEPPVDLNQMDENPTKPATILTLAPVQPRPITASDSADPAYPEQR